MSTPRIVGAALAASLLLAFGAAIAPIGAAKGAPGVERGASLNGAFEGGSCREQGDDPDRITALASGCINIVGKNRGVNVNCDRCEVRVTNGGEITEAISINGRDRTTILVSGEGSSVNVIRNVGKIEQTKITVEEDGKASVSLDGDVSYTEIIAESGGVARVVNEGHITTCNGGFPMPVASYTQICPLGALDPTPEPTLAFPFPSRCCTEISWGDGCNCDGTWYPEESYCAETEEQCSGCNGHWCDAEDPTLLTPAAALERVRDNAETCNSPPEIIADLDLLADYIANQ